MSAIFISVFLWVRNPWKGLPDSESLFCKSRNFLSVDTLSVIPSPLVTCDLSYNLSFITIMFVSISCWGSNYYKYIDIFTCKYINLCLYTFIKIHKLSCTHTTILRLIELYRKRQSVWVVIMLKYHLYRNIRFQRVYIEKSVILYSFLDV